MALPNLTETYVETHFHNERWYHFDTRPKRGQKYFEFDYVLRTQHLSDDFNRMMHELKHTDVAIRFVRPGTEHGYGQVFTGMREDMSKLPPELKAQAEAYICEAYWADFDCLGVAKPASCSWGST